MQIFTLPEIYPYAVFDFRQFPLFEAFIPRHGFVLPLVSFPFIKYKIPKSSSRDVIDFPPKFCFVFVKFDDRNDSTHGVEVEKL